MSEPNYLSMPILFTTTSDLHEKELEMTLIQRLMDKNGWSFPLGDEDTDEYDIAVEEVKWYIAQLKELAQ